MSKQILLIVEDEQTLLKALTSKLSKEGFKIISATDGKKGLDIALKEKPDLILLDIIMPFMDGLTMLNKLRKDKWGKKAKVIMLTNLNDDNSIIASQEKGVHDYLVKTDWSLEDLLKKIKSKLD